MAWDDDLRDQQREVAGAPAATSFSSRTRQHGTIKVAGRDGSVVLSSTYVSTSVELAYVRTVHGAQGGTVDHSLLVIDSQIDGRGLYVGMTRGARTNHAYVAVDGNRTGRDILEIAVHGDWADTPAIDIRTELRLRANLQKRLDEALAATAGSRTASDRLSEIGRREPPDSGLGLGR